MTWKNKGGYDTCTVPNSEVLCVFQDASLLFDAKGSLMSKAKDKIDSGTP